MILYNTLMGVCAGAGMLLVSRMLWDLSDGRMLVVGYGPALLVLGLPLTVLAGAMTLTWPLTVNPPINIAFGEPSLMLGLLLTVAGAVIVQRSGVSVGLVLATASGAAWVVFCVGLVLAAITSAIFSYNLVGDAPPQEPITGQFTGWENTFFGLIYALAALGCLFAPGVRIGQWHWINRLVIYSWALSGAAFLIFSVLNYRTHIGLLINIERGTDYRW